MFGTQCLSSRSVAPGLQHVRYLQRAMLLVRDLVVIRH